MSVRSFRDLKTRPGRELGEEIWCCSAVDAAAFLCCPCCRAGVTEICGSMDLFCDPSHKEEQEEEPTRGCGTSFCGFCFAFSSTPWHVFEHAKVCSRNPNPGSVFLPINESQNFLRKLIATRAQSRVDRETDSSRKALMQKYVDRCCEQQPPTAV